MPDINGPEICKAIQKMVQEIEVVLITQPHIICCTALAYSDEAFYRRAMEAGMDDFLTKPIVFEQIRQLLL